MLGGGTFTTQNKVLPGSYINFVSAARASATLSDRGVVALPIALNWGPEGQVFTITQEDFQKNSLKILGYDYTAAEMLPFREVFKHAQKVHVFNLNSGGGQASCDYAIAKHKGTRGNDLKVVIAKNVDNASKYDVSLYLGTVKVDSQTVATASELVDNDFVTWKRESATLEVTAGTLFKTGVNGTSSNTSHQSALNAFESYNFNVLVGVDYGNSQDVGSLYIEFTKRMRDKVGVKFQTVLNDESVLGGNNNIVDHEGIILVHAPVATLPWVAGAEAGCAVNKSCTNMKYDGELTIATTETQTELETAIKEGYFIFHRVEDEIKVLLDINSLITFTEEKSDVFASNQVIRVIDQCANDTARVFNTKYLGKVQNDKSGRVSFWNDIVTHRRQLETIRAIEDYNADELTVEQGDAKNSVVVRESLVPTSSMEKLYMTCVIE